MTMHGSERVATFRFLNQRKATPASMTDLLEALKRLRAEAALLGVQAYVAIQHHSFEPYWTFRAKIDEHSALIAVIRGRLEKLRELRKNDVEEVGPATDKEEHEILVLTVRSCLKFGFALSANPLLPIGARETFIHEIDALNQARSVLERMPSETVEPGLIDELDTAKMILEEIIEKSPSLADFNRPAAPPPEEGTAPAEGDTLAGR